MTMKRHTANRNSRRTVRRGSAQQNFLDGNNAPRASVGGSEAAAQGPAMTNPNGDDARDPTLAAREAQSRPNDDELWSLRAVIAKTGLSRSSIYAYVDRGIFPRQRHLGPRRVGWLASEVRAWIASRPS